MQSTGGINLQSHILIVGVVIPVVLGLLFISLRMKVTRILKVKYAREKEWFQGAWRKRTDSGLYGLVLAFVATAILMANYWIFPKRAAEDLLITNPAHEVAVTIGLWLLFIAAISKLVSMAARFHRSAKENPMMQFAIAGRFVLIDRNKVIRFMIQAGGLGLYFIALLLLLWGAR